MKKMMHCVALSLLAGATVFASQQPAQAAAGAGAGAAQAAAQPSTSQARYQNIAQLINKVQNNSLKDLFKDPVEILLAHSHSSQGKWKPDEMHWVLLATLLESESFAQQLAHDYNIAHGVRNTEQQKAQDWAAEKNAEIADFSFILTHHHPEKIRTLDDMSKVLRAIKQEESSTLPRLDAAKRFLHLISLVVHGTDIALIDASDSQKLAKVGTADGAANTQKKPNKQS